MSSGGNGHPRLDDDQARAVDMACKGKLLVLTGGPGVGKTFTVNHILDEIDADDVALCAPTGKAAKRLSEATFGRTATTIHRLLHYIPETGGFEYHEKNRLPHDLVIIDESSMLDVRLAKCLLSAIRPDARVVLVGDKDQLPSVGPGNVFRDLIASRVLPVAHLTQIHRQSEHSWIPVNARKINRGERLTIDPKSEDFFVKFIENADDARREIVRFVVEEIPERHGLSPVDVQLLCPQKKGVLGVFELNKELQERLNPPALGAVNIRGFRVRDKVIHTRNNYRLGVMNGETGGVVSAADGKDGKVLCVDYGDRKVSYVGNDLDDLMLAYALTIHKSQGSEWPCVVVPVHSQNAFMLNRNLFYTAVTRGKGCVYVVGNQRGIQLAIKKSDAAQRYTNLADNLRQVFKEAA